MPCGDEEPELLLPPRLPFPSNQPILLNASGADISSDLQKLLSEDQMFSIELPKGIPPGKGAFQMISLQHNALIQVRPIYRLFPLKR